MRIPFAKAHGAKNDDFDFDWRPAGAEIESHPHFPNRTDVSFIRPARPNAIDVRFYERWAGETMSSGRGSTGTAAAALLWRIAQSLLEVLTPAAPLASASMMKFI